ncbi:MAG: hypothetical protein ACTSX6_10510 [Candidatus Heimdallarchaeaceae archaeon]
MLSEKFKKIKVKFSWKKRKDENVLVIPKEWIKNRVNLEKKENKEDFVKILIKKRTITHPTMRWFKRVISGFLVLINFVLGGILFFAPELDFIFKFLAAIFLLNAWMCAHVYRSSERREWIK